MHLKRCKNSGKTVKKKLESRTIFLEDLKVGMKESFSKIITDKDVEKFAQISSDFNPIHFEEEYAKKTIFKRTIVHGMLTASFISAIIGERLPGNGTIYLSQSLKFHKPVIVGQKIVTEVLIKKIEKPKKQITLDCVCKVNEIVVLTGTALVLAPSR